MADLLPQNFPTPTESAIVTYDFADVLSRTGYITFYVVGGDNSSSLFLSPIVIESDSEKYSTERASTGTTELDIDLTFNVAQTIKGRLFTALSYTAYGGNGVGTAVVEPKVRIYHVTSGGTETEIGTQQTLTSISQGSAASYTDTREMAEFNIAEKRFAIGEKLRLNIEFIATIGTNTTATLWHDGANRDITGRDFLNTALPTDIKVLVPFMVVT